MATMAPTWPIRHNKSLIGILIIYLRSVQFSRSAMPTLMLQLVKVSCPKVIALLPAFKHSPLKPKKKSLKILYSKIKETKKVINI